MAAEKASDLPVGRWVKSKFSTVGNCVELGELPDGNVAVRDSKDPDGPALIFTRREILAFLQGARAGNFAQFA